MKREAILSRYLSSQATMIAVEFELNGRIRWANDFTREMIGKQTGNLSVKDFFVDFNNEFDLKKAVKDSAEPQMYNVSGSGGLPQTYYFYFYPVDDGILALGSVDVSEIERLRVELVQNNNQLNNLTRELNKKNAELARLNEIKNHFLGMAAHDLRNPLVSIMGFSNFMVQEPEAFKRPEFLSLLNDIHSLSEFMLKMINDLLDISVIESGNLKLSPEYESFQPLLEETVKIHRVFGEQHDLTLVLENELPEGLIKFDESRMKQVLNNLISNALKFSPSGATITIRAFVDNGQMRVSVRDQGPGIPAEDIPNLFEAYAKIKSVSPRREKQTGLGLAITRKIIVAHHGKVWAESEVGKGSTFHFSLPDFKSVGSNGH